MGLFMTTHGILAIEAGGTKCEMFLVDAETGARLAYARGSREDMPDLVHSHGVGRSPAMMQLVFEKIREQVVELPPCINIVENCMRRDYLEMLALESYQVEVTTVREFDIALALGDVDYGIMVLSGTGAAVILRDSDGSQRAIDGVGPLLGDAGSAFYIGHQTMRHLTRELQVQRREIPYWCEMMDILKLPYDRNAEGDLLYLRLGLHALSEYTIRAVDRSAVASVAMLCEKMALDGDAAALRIMCQAAELLAENVMTLVRKCHISEEELSVIGVGSVLTKSRFVWPSLHEILSTQLPLARIVCPHFSQAEGLVICRLRALGRTEAVKNFTTL